MFAVSLSTASILIVINILLAAVIVFLERKNPTSTVAWLLLLALIPGFGFFIYLIFSQNLTRRKIFRLHVTETKAYDKLLKEQLSVLESKAYDFNDPTTEKHTDMIRLHLMQDDSFYTQNNDIQMFTDGHELFDDIFEEIKNAKDHIHVLFFIIKSDDLGLKLVNALTEKAKEGVEVRLLYDAIGSHMLKQHHIQPLLDAGGQAEAFFKSRFHLVNFKANYRNHRKLVVIDSEKAYIGGFNVGDEYLGLDKKMGYWRDTHLKINGSAVNSIQIRFMLDWRCATQEGISVNERYFKEIESDGKAGVQIVSSGPDSADSQVKTGYLKMINAAKRNIYIQTPYFIPDDSIMDALKIAIQSGVEVKIMIPNKPDHMFVYWATYSYVGELIKYGAKVYTYENGFLHAKLMVIDDEVASVGTTNFDIRSFNLNFEVNAFIYNTDTASMIAKSFEDDVEFSYELTLRKYYERPTMIKFKESISRLLSPLL